MTFNKIQQYLRFIFSFLLSYSIDVFMKIETMKINLTKQREEKQNQMKNKNKAAKKKQLNKKAYISQNIASHPLLELLVLFFIDFGLPAHLLSRGSRGQVDRPSIIIAGSSNSTTTIATILQLLLLRLRIIIIIMWGGGGGGGGGGILVKIKNYIDASIQRLEEYIFLKSKTNCSNH